MVKAFSMNCKYNYSCYYNYVLTIIFGILQVNEQFAINLLAEEPVVVIKGTHTLVQALTCVLACNLW